MAGLGSYVQNDAGVVEVEDGMDFVESRFNLSTAFAATAYTDACNFMTMLNSTIKALEMPELPSIADIQVPEVTGLTYINRPKITALELDTTMPEFNVSVPTMNQVPAITPFQMPSIGFTQPQWQSIERPALTELVKPGDPPSLVTPSVPVAPTITMPSSPVLSNIVIPAAPDRIVPAFDALRPVETLSIPDPFSYNEPNYQSDLWIEILAKMLDDIRNGGTGLDINVEEAIYARAKNKLQTEYSKSLRAIEKKLGASGFDLPSGAVASATLELEAEWSRNITDQLNTITEMQAKLALDNTHFIMEQAIKCEDILRKFFNDQNNRILTASQQVALVGVEVFKAAVGLHNARVEQYKAEALVYESIVRAAQQEIDLFKSKVEAAKVSSEVQALLVDIYQKQVMAVESQVRIYAASLEGAKIQADINNSVIQAYKTKVEAYVASLGGEKLKLELYTAEVDGEKGKAEIYKSQVMAYDTTVNAAVKQTDASIAVSDAVIKNNMALIEIFKAEVTKFSAESDAAVKQLGAIVSGFQAEVSAYNAETTAEASYYTAKGEESRVLIANADIKLRKAIAQIESVTKGYEVLSGLKVEGLKGMMGTAAQLAASALSSTHTAASWGYSGNKSISEGISHGDSLTESHNFDETPA
jgi:hypothetical protein